MQLWVTDSASSLAVVAHKEQHPGRYPVAAVAGAAAGEVVE